MKENGGDSPRRRNLFRTEEKHQMHFQTPCVPLKLAPPHPVFHPVRGRMDHCSVRITHKEKSMFLLRIKWEFIGR